ncbi:hypothetical protein [Brucella anthropi]|uniref:hypothetical protein n=1 Tax=Brucella anthropi TaxID=529 RepID=UPI000F66588D|nr:hypothetical protein [Brucella anthropi]RRY11422.1 hypothetical protein EGJ58_07110 [Brucella anthropi]
MIKWLRDVLGINAYEIAWDFKSNGAHLKGRHDFRNLGGMTKNVAIETVRSMNRLYGEGSHWIELIRR